MNEQIELLKRLNEQTFDAEAKKAIGSAGEEESWDQFLKRVLADEFKIVRAKGQVSRCA